MTGPPVYKFVLRAIRLRNYGRTVALSKLRILITGGSGFIGTNLIEHLCNSGHREILNIDISQPKIPGHNCFWINCDILNTEELLERFILFKPTVVVHLAARTDSEGKSLAEYEANTKGTANVLKCIDHCGSVVRAVITSTQFVHYGKELPKDDNDYLPYTVYGESKVITERLTREANLKCGWTIIRPTRVWGYWQPGRLAFYKMLRKGIYFHPGKQPVMRAFGYVGNVIYQIMQILHSEKDIVDRKVFYVGDMPINLVDWVEEFARQIGNRRVIYMPRFFVRTIAKVGDALTKLGLPFPISTFRYKSLITSDDAPMKLTFETLGNPPYSLKQGVEETLTLLRKYYPYFLM
ncbi:MAG: NAD(P)-dependent oxidoreductase [Syntrophales bacterium]